MMLDVPATLTTPSPASVIPPEVWGPPFWRTIHYVAMAYDPGRVQVEQVRAWFQSLPHVLPCPECARHLKRAMAAGGPYYPHDAVFRDRTTLFEYTVELHNSVNRRLGKPQLDVRAAREALLTVPPSQHRNHHGPPGGVGGGDPPSMLQPWHAVLVMVTLIGVLVAFGVVLPTRWSQCANRR